MYNESINDTFSNCRIKKFDIRVEIFDKIVSKVL